VENKLEIKTGQRLKGLLMLLSIKETQILTAILYVLSLRNGIQTIKKLEIKISII